MFSISRINIFSIQFLNKRILDTFSMYSRYHFFATLIPLEKCCFLHKICQQAFLANFIFKAEVDNFIYTMFACLYVSFATRSSHTASTAIIVTTATTNTTTDTMTTAATTAAVTQLC